MHASARRQMLTSSQTGFTVTDPVYIGEAKTSGCRSLHSGVLFTENEAARKTKFGFIVWPVCPSRGADVCDLERAADPLHCADSNTKPRGDLAHALCAARGLQGVVDSLF